MQYQYNAVSKMPYQGKNQAELFASKEKNGFTSNQWVTFLQAKGLGRNIKKGSKSVAIFKGFAKTTELDKNGKPKEGSAPLGFAYVFNLDQTELTS